MTPDRIRAIRLRLGWTQREMAEALGVSLRSVYRWEAGEHGLSGSARKMYEMLEREATIPSLRISANGHAQNCLRSS